MFDLRYSTTAEELQNLYNLMGWNKDGVRTIDICEKILKNSAYYLAVYDDDKLIGFGRILSDGFVCQVLDIMTHPAYRRKGIAARVMQNIMAFITDNYTSAMLIDGSGLPHLYEAFGFETSTYGERVMYWNI